MRRKGLLKRSVALVLAGVLMFNVAPMGVSAEENIPQVGDVVKTASNGEKPESVLGGVWVEGESKSCLLPEHIHSSACYEKTCNHKNGHLPTCYGTTWGVCPDADTHEHTESYYITLKTIGGLKNLPGIGDFIKSYGRNAYKLYNKTVCYSIDVNLLNCEHVCTEFTGKEEGCYGFKSIIEGGCDGLSHEHNLDCTYCKWTLHADINNNGNPDENETYTIRYVNWDGTELQSSKHLVDTTYPIYAGIPERPSDVQYKYEFSGWDVEPSTTVTGNVIHTAKYKETVNEYTVTWYNHDGSDVLEMDENVPYGTKVSYDGEMPTKTAAEGENVVYTFVGWDPEVTEATVVKGDMKFSPVFSEKDVFEVKFNVEGASATKYVVDGEKAEVYAPTKTYYTLDGWYTSPNYADDTKFDFETPITGAKDLFAEWVPVNDKNNDGIADEEQACGVTVIGDVKDVEVSGNKIPGQTITISAKPIDGKFITGVIKVNGTVYETEVTFNKTKATFAYELPAGEAADYTFEVQTADATVSLYSEYVNWNSLMSDEEAEKSVFENVNFGEMPSTVVENTIVTYKSGLTDLTWIAIGADLPLFTCHEFGAEGRTEETVRLTFAGNDQVPGFRKEFKVILKDDRLASKIEANDVTFTYSPSVTKAEMEKAIFDAAFVAATSEDGTVALDAVYGENVFVKNANVNAGTHTVTIEFSGTSEYAASSAEVTVTVKKADSYTNVSDANVKYGTEVNASALIDTGAAERVEFVAGLSMGKDASTDAKTIVYVNMPELVDTDSLPELVKSIVDGLLSGLKEGTEISISDLNEYLTDILDVFGSYGEDIPGLNIDADAVSSLISVLKNLENIEGVGDIKIKLSFDGKLKLTDAGMYIVGAVVSDANYNPSFGANYVVITPDGYKAVLDWEVKDDNGLVRKDALDTYDFGAKVVKVYEGNIDDAQKNITTFFMGVDANGEATVTYDPTELQVGVYTQIAFIKDLGNTMYYAEPIQRVFAVVPQIATVKVDDAEKVYNGEAQEADVTVELPDGAAMKPGCLQVTYVGLDVNGEVYESTQAPTNTGAYAVLATYLEKVNGVYEYVGFDAGLMVISPADAELKVEKDAYAIYDGEEHWPTITNTNNLELIKIVADDKGNVNVILPESYGVEPTELNAKDAVDELVEVLKNIYAGDANVAVMAAEGASTEDIMMDIISRLEAIGVDVYEMLAEAMDVDSIIAAAKRRAEAAAEALKNVDLDAVRKEVELTLNGIEVKNLSINGAGPIEEGVYTVSVFGYAKNYKLETARGSIEIHEHDWVDADCTTPKTCEECKETEGEALGHDWADWVTTKKPTTSSKGEQRRDCNRCDEFETRPLDKLPAAGGSGSGSSDDKGTELEGVYEAPTAPTAPAATATAGASTGDSANILGYVSLFVAAGAAMVLLFFKKKRA